MEKEYIFKWLKIAFKKDKENEVETFYYDTFSKKFFTITLLEKFLISKNNEINFNLSPYYSSEELEQIKNWLQKIAQKDTSIIQLPTIGIATSDEHLTEQINQFLFKNAIRLSLVSVFEILQKEALRKKIITQPKKNIKTWWKFW